MAQSRAPPGDRQLERGGSMQLDAIRQGLAMFGSKHLMLVAVALFLSAPSICDAAEESERSTTYHPKKLLRDVVQAPSEQWLEHLSNRPIERVVVKAKRQGGSADTTLTLELNGSALDEGQKSIDRSTLHTIVWDLRARRPRATQIELEAAQGDVFVESVTIDFFQPSRAALMSSERVPDDTFKHVRKITERTEEAMKALNRQAARDRTLRPNYSIHRSLGRFAAEVSRFREDLRSSRNHFQRLIDASAELRQSFNTVHRELTAAKPHDPATLLALKDVDELLLELERELGGTSRLPEAYKRSAPEARTPDKAEGSGS